MSSSDSFHRPKEGSISGHVEKLLNLNNTSERVMSLQSICKVLATAHDAQQLLKYLVAPDSKYLPINGFGAHEPSVRMGVLLMLQQACFIPDPNINIPPYLVSKVANIHHSNLVLCFPYFQSFLIDDCAAIRSRTIHVLINLLKPIIRTIAAFTGVIPSFNKYSSLRRRRAVLQAEMQVFNSSEPSVDLTSEIPQANTETRQAQMYQKKFQTSIGPTLWEALTNTVLICSYIVDTYAGTESIVKPVFNSFITEERYTHFTSVLQQQPSSIGHISPVLEYLHLISISLADDRYENLKINSVPEFVSFPECNLSKTLSLPHIVSFDWEDWLRCEEGAEEDYDDPDSRLIFSSTETALKDDQVKDKSSQTRLITNILSTISVNDMSNLFKPVVDSSNSLGVTNAKGPDVVQFTTDELAAFRSVKQHSTMTLDHVIQNPSLALSAWSNTSLLVQPSARLFWGNRIALVNAADSTTLSLLATNSLVKAATNTQDHPSSKNIRFLMLLMRLLLKISLIRPRNGHYTVNGLVSISDKLRSITNFVVEKDKHKKKTDKKNEPRTKVSGGVHIDEAAAACDTLLNSKNTPSIFQPILREKFLALGGQFKKIREDSHMSKNKNQQHLQPQVLHEADHPAILKAVDDLTKRYGYANVVQLVFDSGLTMPVPNMVELSADDITSKRPTDLPPYMYHQSVPEGEEPPKPIQITKFFFDFLSQFPSVKWEGRKKMLNSVFAKRTRNTHRAVAKVSAPNHRFPAFASSRIEQVQQSYIHQNVGVDPAMTAVSSAGNVEGHGFDNVTALITVGAHLMARMGCNINTKERKGLVGNNSLLWNSVMQRRSRWKDSVVKLVYDDNMKTPGSSLAKRKLELVEGKKLLVSDGKGSQSKGSQDDNDDSFSMFNTFAEFVADYPYDASVMVKAILEKQSVEEDALKNKNLSGNEDGQMNDGEKKKLEEQKADAVKLLVETEKVRDGYVVDYANVLDDQSVVSDGLETADLSLVVDDLLKGFNGLSNLRSLLKTGSNSTNSSSSSNGKLASVSSDVSVRSRDSEMDDDQGEGVVKKQRVVSSSDDAIVSLSTPTTSKASQNNKSKVSKSVTLYPPLLSSQSLTSTLLYSGVSFNLNSFKAGIAWLHAIFHSERKGRLVETVRNERDRSEREVLERGEWKFNKVFENIDELVSEEGVLSKSSPISNTKKDVSQDQGEFASQDAFSEWKDYAYGSYTPPPSTTPVDSSTVSPSPSVNDVESKNNKRVGGKPEEERSQVKEGEVSEDTVDDSIFTLQGYSRVLEQRAKTTAKYLYTHNEVPLSFPVSLVPHSEMDKKTTDSEASTLSSLPSVSTTPSTSSTKYFPLLNSLLKTSSLLPVHTTAKHKTKPIKSKFPFVLLSSRNQRVFQPKILSQLPLLTRPAQAQKAVSTVSSINSLTTPSPYPMYDKLVILFAAPMVSTVQHKILEVFFASIPLITPTILSYIQGCLLSSNPNVVESSLSIVKSLLVFHPYIRAPVYTSLLEMFLSLKGQAERSARVIKLLISSLRPLTPSSQPSVLKDNMSDSLVPVSPITPPISVSTDFGPRMFRRFLVQLLMTLNSQTNPHINPINISSYLQNTVDVIKTNIVYRKKVAEFETPVESDFVQFPYSISMLPIAMQHHSASNTSTIELRSTLYMLMLLLTDQPQLLSHLLTTLNSVTISYLLHDAYHTLSYSASPSLMAHRPTVVVAGQEVTWVDCLHRMVMWKPHKDHMLSAPSSSSSSSSNSDSDSDFILDFDSFRSKISSALPPPPLPPSNVTVPINKPPPPPAPPNSFSTQSTQSGTSSKNMKINVVTLPDAYSSQSTPSIEKSLTTISKYAPIESFTFTTVFLQLIKQLSTTSYSAALYQALSSSLTPLTFSVNPVQNSTDKMSDETTDNVSKNPVNIPILIPSALTPFVYSIFTHSLPILKHTPPSDSDNVSGSGEGAVGDTTDSSLNNTGANINNGLETSQALDLLKDKNTDGSATSTSSILSPFELIELRSVSSGVKLEAVMDVNALQVVKPLLTCIEGLLANIEASNTLLNKSARPGVLSPADSRLRMFPPNISFYIYSTARILVPVINSLSVAQITSVLPLILMLDDPLFNSPFYDLIHLTTHNPNFPLHNSSASSPAPFTTFNSTPVPKESDPDSPSGYIRYQPLTNPNDSIRYTQLALKRLYACSNSPLTPSQLLCLLNETPFVFGVSVKHITTAITTVLEDTAFVSANDVCDALVTLVNRPTLPLFFYHTFIKANQIHTVAFSSRLLNTISTLFENIVQNHPPQNDSEQWKGFKIISSHHLSASVVGAVKLPGNVLSELVANNMRLSNSLRDYIINSGRGTHHLGLVNGNRGKNKRNQKYQQQYQG